MVLVMAVPYEYGLNSKFHIMYSLHNNKLLNPGENKNKNIYVHTWVPVRWKLTWNMSEVPYNNPKTYSWKYNPDHKAIFLLQSEIITQCNFVFSHICEKKYIYVLT